MSNALREGLRKLLNENSAENGSNTPDWILSDFLYNVLKELNGAVNKRASWYGRRDGPGQSNFVSLEESNAKALKDGPEEMSKAYYEEKIRLLEEQCVRYRDQLAPGPGYVELSSYKQLELKLQGAYESLREHMRMVREAQNERDDAVAAEKRKDNDVEKYIQLADEFRAALAGIVHIKYYATAEEHHSAWQRARALLERTKKGLE